MPEPFEIRKRIEPEGIDVVLRDSEGQLCVSVDSENPDYAGLVVEFRMAVPGRADIVHNIRLESRQSYGPHGFVVLEEHGPLGEECVFVAGISGRPTEPTRLTC